MGRSVTIHCIGQGRDRNERHYLYPAMSRLEIMQQERVAIRNGDRILLWHAQTRAGSRILGDELDSRRLIAPSFIPKVKVIGCPACFGEGCAICNLSGITTKRHVSRYQGWQIERIQGEHRK